MGQGNIVKLFGFLQLPIDAVQASDPGLEPCVLDLSGRGGLPGQAVNA